VANSNGNPALGVRLRALRKQRQLKLATLAFQSNVSLAYISEVERGRKLPSLEVLDRIAGALGMSVVEVLGGVTPYNKVSARTKTPVRVPKLDRPTR
jgi:transcriptional regulator with XRE-family HTH domain